MAWTPKHLQFRTYFMRQMPKKCLGNVSNTDFVQEFAFYCTVQFVSTEKLTHVLRKAQFENRTKLSGQPSLTLYKSQQISTCSPYPDISPRDSWLPITGVSETLDSKWLIPIFFDNLIMQRIRKGRQSGWKLRKMRKNEKRLNRGWLKAKIEMRD